MGPSHKTRLGIHTNSSQNNSEEGLIILDIYGDDKQKEGFTKALEELGGIKIKSVEFS